MKKMLVLLTAFALTLTAATAQTTPPAQPQRATQERPQASPELRADRLTQRLTQQLSLSPDQAAKVREITLAQTREDQALRGKYAVGPRKGAGPEMRALAAKYDAQLKAVLNADQLAQYGQLRAAQTGKRQEKMQARRLKAKS